MSEQNLYVVICYDSEEDWWAPPTTVSNKLPYYSAMNHMQELKEQNPSNTYQVMMRECHIPGKK